MSIRLRYYCHAGLDTGYGRAAVDLARALASHPGVQIEMRQIGSAPLAGRALPLARYLDGPGLPPDVVLVHTLPADCAEVLRREQIDPRATPCIAYTTWETSGFWSQWNGAVAAGGWGNEGVFADVWAPGMSRGTDGMGTPLQGYDSVVYWMPHCFDPDEIARNGRGRGERRRVYTATETPETVRFYWMGAWNSRKNPLGVLRAFAAAFTEADVHLSIHSPKVDLATWACALASMARDMEWMRSHTSLSTVLLDDRRVWDYHVDHDIYVTASRGEAWNLGAFEAALVGNHVLAPFGQGSDCYLTERSSTRHHALGMEPAGHDAHIQRSGHQLGQIAITVTGPRGIDPRHHQWQVPNIGALADDMRRAAGQAALGELPRTDWRDPAFAPFTHTAVAARAVDRLEHVITRFHQTRSATCPPP